MRIPPSRRACGAGFILALLLTACVTINVYFPAAQAQEAARDFVDKVIGQPARPASPSSDATDPGAPPPASPGLSLLSLVIPTAQAQAAPDFKIRTSPSSDATDPGAPPPASPGLSLLSLVIPTAQAQAAPDFKIRTPAIQAIEARMAQRFSTTLKPAFDAGALGFGKDGLVTVRDATKVALKDRVALNQAVADDNRDRKAVYREIAVANGHPEWEPQIRETFARQWIDGAHAGWWYQGADGAWKRK